MLNLYLREDGLPEMDTGRGVASEFAALFDRRIYRSSEKE